MTDTAVSYRNRANARRAAGKLLTDGTAPAVDYGIKERDDGRFHIVWKTGNRTPATTGKIETEIATATAAEPSAAGSELAQPAAPAATEPTQAEPTPQPAAKAETAPAPTSAASAPIGAESEPEPQGDHDPELAAFDTLRLIAELTRRGYRSAQARQRRTQRPASGPRRSKADELDEAAARGVMPTKPDVTSHANHHYQKRFDKLAELAAAGDWDAVAGYQCEGRGLAPPWPACRPLGAAPPRLRGAIAAPRQLGDQPRRVKGGELGIMVALPRGLRLGANRRGGHGGGPRCRFSFRRGLRPGFRLSGLSGRKQSRFAGCR
jgi:hypothetical protein